MKKILVPTDFSECAEAATTVALVIAQKAGAEIYFLHLFTSESEYHTVSPPQKFIDEKRLEIGHTKAALEKLVADAKQVGVKATIELSINKVNDQLEDFIVPFGIDLVVMGSNGARGLKEIFIGSNTQRLIWNSPVPVLVIKSKPKNFEAMNLVFASDFKYDAKKPFDAIADMIGLWNGKLHLLYVNTPNHFKETNEVLMDMKRYMSQFKGIEYTPHIYNARDEERGIHQFAMANKVDLIAMATYGRTGFAALTHGVAECLINHEKIPVLVVNLSAELEPEEIDNEKNPVSNQFF